MIIQKFCWKPQPMKLIILIAVIITMNMIA